jgi:hypothetical protein
MSAFQARLVCGAFGLGSYPPHYRTAFAFSLVLHRPAIRAPCGDPYSSPFRTGAEE